MLILLICGLVAAWPASGQIPAGYEIVQVTQNPYYEPFPRINNHGQIVFTAWLDTSSRLTEEIFLYDNGELIQLTDDEIQDVGPDINDDGTIVWARGLGPIHPSTGEPSLEIVMYRDGEITRLTDNAVHDAAPRINNLGQVVWDRSHDVYACGGYLIDIFMFDGKRIIQITTDAIPEQVENQAPEINDFGEIVWTRYDFCNPPPGYNFRSKIMMYSGGVISELTTEQVAAMVPDINNRGQVVWSSLDTATGNLGIELWEAGITTLLTDDGDNPAINNHSDIAFQRWDDTSQRWNAWLYRYGGFYQLTDDDRDDNVPDINDGREVAWGSGGFPEEDIRVLKRVAANEVGPDGRFEGVTPRRSFDAFVP
jgi:hypothetical protein